MLVKRNSKNIITIWENFDPKKMSSRSKGQPKKNHTTLMCGHGWWWDVDGHILMHVTQNKLGLCFVMGVI